MKIMIIDSLPEDVLSEVLSNNVVYRPDLGRRSPSVLLDALRNAAPDALVSSMEFDLAILSLWRPGVTKDVVRIRLTIDPDLNRTVTEQVGDGFVLTTVAASDPHNAYRLALEELERLAIDRLVRNGLQGARTGRSLGRREILMVGAGLVNLVTAYRLMEDGWEVRVLDAAPDPSSEASWRSFGCSRGGDDARMFTLSEMDNYNDRAHSATMNTFFNRNVASAGWGACRPGSLTQDELSWISDYEVLPPWLANRYNEDIFSLSRDSRKSWEGWLKREPDLFARCETRPDILRIYSDPGHLRAAVERQKRIGATIRILSASEVGAYEPALRDPAESGAIAGGILVIGFTVNAHKFMAQLVSRMMARGACFQWNTRVERVLFDDAGNIEGLDCGDRIARATNYVVSPGAYGGRILEGTRCEGQIHGVLGAWLRLPNIEPHLVHSLKLARKGHVTEDANVTVATDLDGAPIMIIGSGYGHTGVDPMNVDDSQLRKIYDGLIDTAEKFFPQAYAASRAAGNLEASLKYCVRPWTSNGLGLFEIRATATGGRFIITGGHNTGGFAQSPTVADAVVAGLEGQSHDMHSLYHPDRASNFLERRRSASTEIDCGTVHSCASSILQISRYNTIKNDWTNFQPNVQPETTANDVRII